MGGRFVDKNHPEKSCCRDCAQEWSKDRCHWGWSSNLHGNLSGAFHVPFGHEGKPCYIACMTITKNTYSALDFCSHAGILAAVNNCSLAVESITTAMEEAHWNDPD